MPSQQTSGKAADENREENKRELRCQTSAIDSLNIQAEAPQLGDNAIP